MMPGETHPAAPGPAAGLSRCQGCASLQQNLNEYVDALITLKQKIINTDNLLTEYQKKCDELQFARRENSTLHHQVEQMLQKISPLQKCQEELGSLKAELEEKKSSLKLYQDTQQEYTRVKEECLRTDAQKKKLEAKVKKLEEAAVRQTEDFKQLRNEKKILEKEFKKTQERLDEFSKQKNEKELRHIGTQISSDSYGSIDRRKVKLLLKELWLCINAAHRLPGEGSRCVLEQPAKDSTRCVSSGEDGALPPAQRSPLRTPDPQPCLTDVSMELEGDCDSHESVEPERSSRASHSPDRVLSNDRVAELPVQSALHSGRPAFADQQHSFDKDLQAAIDFFKLPPPLLSPVPSPPRMSSPHPGSLPSPPVPETYVEEYTDSSDDDPAQPRTSGESVLDDSAESQDCFGLRRRSMGSGTWDEKPEAQECVQAPNAGQVYQVRAAGLETSAAAPREPSGSESKAESSKVMGGRGRAASREAGARMEVRELDKSVQTEEPVPRAVWLAELCGRLERDKEVDPGQAASCYSALGKRSLKELTTAEPATRFSKVMEPQSESAKWAVTEDVACVSDSAAISHHTRRASGEAAKAAGVQGSEADAAGSGVRAAGPLETRRPSSTSVVQSVRRNPWSRQSRFVGNTDGPTTVIPARLCPSEQTLETTAVNTSPVRSEPPGCPAAGSDPESKFHALSSALGISSVGGQRGSKSEGTDIIKGFPHSVFMKATKDGQCESEGPGLELRLTKSDFTSVINSRADSVSNASGFAKSTSWHHSDLLRRSGEEVLPAKSEHAQKIGLPLQQGRPSLQSRGSTSSLELGGENANPVEFKPAAAQLPNQVSVIMKQTRPETVQRLARSEPPAGARPGDPEGSRAPPVAQRTGEAEDAAARLKAVAAASSSSPEVSTSWKKLDFDSPSGSSLVESVDGSTTSRAAFSSEHIPPQKRDVVREAAAREEVPKQRRFPQAPDPDSSGWEGGGLPPASEAAESGGLPREEMPCGVAARAGSEALAVDSGSPDTPPSARGLLGLKSKTSAFPDWLLPAGTAAPSAFCSKGEETRDAPPGSLPGPLYAYTGIRERGGEAAEAEESEALSCSEGEHEAEGAVGSSQQDASGPSPGSAGGSVAEAGASVDVGLLASALEDCTISTLPDIDRLSASDVVLFLESCQLKDCSSGDSVSECSGRETSNREMSQELKQDGMSAGRPSRQPCEEALGAAEEWIESEDEDSSLRSPSPPPQCSLETLSAVLTEMGQELQVSCENCPGPAGRRTPLQHHGMPSESEEGRVPSQEIASSSHAPGVPLASVDARGSSPVADGPRGHIQDRPEGHPGAAGQAGGGEEGLGSASAPEPAAEGEPGDAQAAFQCQISTVTSEVISVLINKDQNLVIEKGDNWTIVSGVSVVPDVGQLIVCEAPEDVSELDAESTAAVSMAKCPDADAPGPPSREPLGSSSVSCTQEDVSSSGQSANFDKSRLRNRPVKPSIWISSQIYDQTFETQVAASDHTYYNSKLEPCSKNKNRSKIVNKEPAGKPAKALASGKAEVHSGEVSQSCPEGRGGAKTQRSQAQPVLANADTSTPTDCSPDTLSKIRQEVGPPLPPLLAPLVATPPRTWQPLSPLISSSSPSSPISPVGQTSPSCEAPAPAVPSPWLEGPRHTSPALPSASPSAASAGERIPSSPLQFCAATPKHALPVPGRLPACASGHATAGAPPQENSVKILDSMYPELSARARTLSLLKGNIRLARGADSGSLSGPVGALKAFKAITSASTAFVKTGSSSAGDSSCKSQGSGTQQESGGKRGLSTCPLRSAKRLCLGRGSAEPESPEGSAGAHESLEGSCSQGEVSTEASSCVPAVSADSQRPLNPKETVESHDKAIADALRKVAESTFDLLPVIRSHVYVGNISKKPVMRDQEKEVVHEFSTTKKHLAECLLHSILAELKVEKTRLEHSYVHALCRVYVGVCRQLGDLERARLFCYSLLKEDFPESEKLTLFIANMWRDVFVSQSVVSHAMQLVARQRARGEVLNCLRAFLGWEKNASVDVGFMISKLLLTIQLCPKTEFQSSGTFGEDLSDQAWEYVFAIDLLCCHQKWIWTHDNIISKELWPVMDKWIKYRKGHTNITYTPDIIIASILRLIGRLGQLGLKEGFPSAVKNISSVIGMFIQHAQDEDIPWGVQLAAVYALCDLSPSNPAEIAKILEAWRRKTSRSIPCAVTSYLEEVSSLSAEGRG